MGGREEVQEGGDIYIHINNYDWGAFQVEQVVKNPPAKVGNMGLIPGFRRSPGGGNGNLLQHSCLENSMDRGSWWATVHRVTKSQTGLKQLSTHTRTKGLNTQVLSRILDYAFRIS